MSPDPRWQRIDDLYHAALECDASERLAFLETACRGDDRLRNEVAALLAEGASDEFLVTPALELAARELAAAADALIGRDIGPYRIVSLLGAGGMGQVYRAHDLKLDRDVALKVLPASVAHDPDRVARFAREARLLATLNHPHIATIYGLAEADGVQALVLELVEGETLADRIARGPLRAADAIAIATQMADGLEAAHARGIIHRDLKPANIKLRPDGTIKILDFGLAKALTRSWYDAEQAGSTATLMGVITGTPAYMSPEQAQGHAVDQRADVWAFGCVFYEMLTGARPFRGGNAVETLAVVMGSEPDWSALPRELPSHLRPFLKRCLAKDATQRIGDIHTMRLALDGAFETGATTPSRGAGPARVRLGWRALAGVGVIIAIGVGAMATLRWRPDTQEDLTPLEFVIPPAPGTSWGTVPIAPNPAVSPDGRYVAVLAQASGAKGLWLHDLQSGLARQLLRMVDNNNDIYPFWSPDSAALAVCGQDGVRIVGLDNRPPEFVKTPPCSYGAWHATAGWLLTTDAGLVRTSPRGGTPEPVTTIDTSRGELRHSYSRWLPDGRHFVFLIRAQTPERRGIYLGSLDNTPARRLLSESANPVYVTEGNGRGLLLYVRGSTLVARRFDEERLMLLPDVYPLGQRVRLGITGRSGSFDASERLLVFRSGGGFQETRLIWLDRAGRQIGEVGPDEAYRLAPSLSPDERTLLYGRFNEETNALELWTTDLERGASAPLLKSSDASLETPRWSPNGSVMAYISAERGFFVPWLLTATGQRTPLGSPTDTGATAQAIASTGADLDLEWTPDSKYLLRWGDGRVRGFAVDGSGKTVTVMHRDVVTRVSPDGRWIAYEANDTGQREVYVERFGGGGQRRVSLDGGFSPQWRADGTELFFRAAPDRMMVVKVQLGDSLHIGQPRVLFRAPFEPSGSATASSSDYLVTRDAQRFLITVPVVSVKPLTARRNWRARLASPH